MEQCICERAPQLEQCICECAQVGIFVRALEVQAAGGAGARWLPAVLAALPPSHAAAYVGNYAAVAAGTGDGSVWEGLVDLVAGGAAGGDAGAAPVITQARLDDLRERVPKLDASLRALGK